MTERLLTVKEACGAMNVGRTLLYEMLKVGVLKSVKIGTRGVRVPVSEIERYIQESLER